MGRAGIHDARLPRGRLSSTPGAAEAQFGDVVVYRKDGEISHVGIVARKNLYIPDDPQDPLVILSKWGQIGEYEHDLTDVPYLLGKPAEYWTDRK